MSKPSHPCPSSISSSVPASGNASLQTHATCLRPLAGSASSSPPAHPTYPSEPSSPSKMIALPFPPPPYFFWPVASEGNAAGGGCENKNAWNIPNVGAMAEGPLVMGVDCWPKLAKSVPPRASAKSSPSGSSKAVSDASSIASFSKGGDGSSSSSSLANDGRGTSRQRPDFSEMSGVADERRQKSSSDGPANKGKSGSGRHRNTQFVPQVQVGPHHCRGNQGGKGRGNSGGRPGESAHNWCHGNRHGNDQRGCYWNGNPSLGRNPPVWMPFPQPQTQSQPFVPLPPAWPLFFPMPPHVHPYIGPMGFPDMDPSPPYRPRGPPPFETLKQMPFIGPQVPPEVPFALLFPQVPQSRPKLKEQIEYYFSDENLCKDLFLRKHMDDQGWVPVSLIATFNRVRSLTTNIQYILNTLQDSKVVEVQGAKIRRRDKWMTWLLPSAQTYNELLGNGPGSANQSSSNQTLAQDSKLTQNTSRPAQ